MVLRTGRLDNRLPRGVEIEAGVIALETTLQMDPHRGPRFDLLALIQAYVLDPVVRERIQSVIADRAPGSP